jgi:hypothetical protein
MSATIAAAEREAITKKMTTPALATLTEKELESYTERVGIMRYDGGLSYCDATAKALECVLTAREAAPKPTAVVEAAAPSMEPERAEPAPMHAGEVLAVTDADGNPLEAKFAGASKPFTYRDTETNSIKRARQEKHAPTVIALTANVTDAELVPETTPGPQAQAAPPKSTGLPSKIAIVETAPAETLWGQKAIVHITTHGIPVKNWYDKSPDNEATSYTLNASTLWRQDSKFKAFIRGAFLCLDIDRKPADIATDPLHGDGLRNFYLFLKKAKIPYEELGDLQDIIAGSFPCYVTTPSGGYHLYFKYDGPPIKGELAPHVEIKTQSLTAPGSFKDGKPYILHGSLSAAPPLPKFIANRLPKPKPIPARRLYPLGKENFDGKTSWEKIVEFTDKDGKGTAGYAEWAYSAAVHAKTHNWNYTDTLEALRNEPEIEGLEDSRIVSAVDSAFK